MAEETSRIVLRLPAWMHERLKVEAFRRNVSMNELAVKILRAWFKYLDRPEKVPERVREVPERKEPSAGGSLDDDEWM